MTCMNNTSEKAKCEESYNEGDDGEEEEQVGDLGREESVSFALRQHLTLLQHQIDEGKQHPVYHRLHKNITMLKMFRTFGPTRKSLWSGLTHITSLRMCVNAKRLDWVQLKRNSFYLQICPASIWTTTHGCFRSAQRVWRWATRRRYSQRNPAVTAPEHEYHINTASNKDPTRNLTNYTQFGCTFIYFILQMTYSFTLCCVATPTCENLHHLHASIKACHIIKFSFHQTTVRLQVVPGRIYTVMNSHTCE